MLIVTHHSTFPTGQMSSAEKLVPRYTVRDYRLWKGDWELWDGIAIAMSPSPFGRHQAIVANLIRQLGNAIEDAQCHASVIGELDWIVRDDTVVRPDVMIICGQVPEKHLREPPGLVAEVLSDSTRRNDLGYKRDLYAEQGVPEYWIIDPDNELIDVLKLCSGPYESTTVGRKITTRVCDDCPIEVDINDLLKT